MKRKFLFEDNGGCSMRVVELYPDKTPETRGYVGVRSNGCAMSWDGLIIPAKDDDTAIELFYRGETYLREQLEKGNFYF